MQGNRFAEFMSWGYGTGFVLYFVGLWCFICYSLGWIGGWHALAQCYRCEREFEGEMWRLRSGKMRWIANFGNCLTLGANREGLYLAVLFLFRPGQPPLFIPWSEITVQQERRWFMWWTRFTLGKETRIPLLISKRLGDQILRYRPAEIDATENFYSRPGLDDPRTVV